MSNDEVERDRNGYVANPQSAVVHGEAIAVAPRDKSVVETNPLVTGTDPRPQHAVLANLAPGLASTPEPVEAVQESAEEAEAAVDEEEVDEDVVEDDDEVV